MSDANGSTVRVVIAAVGYLGKQNPRRSGTNSIFPSEVVAVLARGHELCQDARVPAGTVTVAFEPALTAAEVIVVISPVPSDV